MPKTYLKINISILRYALSSGKDRKSFLILRQYGLGFHEALVQSLKFTIVLFLSKSKN